MARCYFNRITNNFNHVWGHWVVDSNVPNNMIKFCRKAFKGRYKNYWIRPVYFDDKYIRYTDEFFSEVGAILYPKKTKLPKLTDENKDRYGRIVFEASIQDVPKEEDFENTKIICIVVKGIRYKDEDENEYTDDGFKEKIISVREVDESVIIE